MIVVAGGRRRVGVLLLIGGILARHGRRGVVGRSGCMGVVLSIEWIVAARLLRWVDMLLLLLLLVVVGRVVGGVDLLVMVLLVLLLVSMWAVFGCGEDAVLIVVVRVDRSRRLCNR